MSIEFHHFQRVPLVTEKLPPSPCFMLPDSDIALHRVLPKIVL